MTIIGERIENGGQRCDVADDGSLMVSLMLMLAIVLAGAGLIVDGGRAMAARRHATNVAEAAARAGVSVMSPMDPFDSVTAIAAAREHASRSGISAADVQVGIEGSVVVVTIVERRRAVFLILGGWSTVTVKGTGRATVVYSP